MNVLPLLFLEALTEDEIEQQECSDRIWMSPDQFRVWTENAEGVANIVRIQNSLGHSVLGTPHAIHHGPPKTLFIPSWMIQELTEDTEHCILERAEPGMCTGFVLQPHTSEHLAFADPQEALRDAFEQYSCLTPGTTIPIWIGTHTMTVSIAQMSPTPDTTLCIRNCELTLELLRPLDMPEEKEEPVSVVAGAGPVKADAVNEIIEKQVPIDAVARRALMAAAARKRLEASKIEAEN